jgi:hypothetical protein
MLRDGLTRGEKGAKMFDEPVFSILGLVLIMALCHGIVVLISVRRRQWAIFTLTSSSMTSIALVISLLWHLA